MTRFISILILVGLLAASGCGQKPVEPKIGKVTSEDVRRDASKTIETAAEFSQQTKEEFQKKLDSRLKELDAEIAKLREKRSSLFSEQQLE
jgi:TolA-binding protein